MKYFVEIDYRIYSHKNKPSLVAIMAIDSYNYENS